MTVRPLNLWTIYDHPSDRPDAFVARRWAIAADGDFHPEMLAFVSVTIEPLRLMMERLGLTRLARNETDDPVIVESWL